MQNCCLSMFSFLLVTAIAFVANIAQGQTSVDRTVKTEAGKAKKRVAKAKDDLNEEGISTGKFGSSSKQEPKPGPYLGEFAANFSFDSKSGTSKVGTQDAAKETGTEIEFSTTYQFILGKFSIGPAVAYKSETTKSTLANTTETETESITGFGLQGQVFLADIHSDKLVPFAGLTYIITNGSTSTKTVDADDSDNNSTTKLTASGNVADITIGAKYFLVRHISLDPAIAYRMSSTTVKDPDKAENGTSKVSSTAIRLVAGLSMYL